jgi:phytoene dehydrogenase-like protein
MSKKVIIAGAGIAGLSAGCYLQMSGFDTEIFEMHTLPGGLCTSWKKKDYTIDGCIHWLVGSGPGDPFYSLWNELIDMKSLTFYNSDEYIRVEDDNCKSIRVYADIDKLEAEFLLKAPEDRSLILELTAAARRISRIKLPVDKPQELFTSVDMLKFLVNVGPHFGLLRKWSKISIAEYASRFHNPLLASTINAMFVPEMSALFMLMTIGWFHRKSAGYPVGGSLKFSQLIEDKYKALGGKIHYGKKVDEILVREIGNEHEAFGITLTDKCRHEADLVISTADGYDTVFRMLGGKFMDEPLRKIYDNYTTFSSYIQVSIGVARKFDPQPMTYIPLENELIVDPKMNIDFLGFRIHHFDPTLAPEGKTLITVMIPTCDHEYWVNLRHDDPHSYKAEKHRLAKEVIKAIDLRLGNVEGLIEMEDVSTPATVVRYTNNWKGSFEGWILTPDIALKQMKKQLPGLRKFYMAGQWVEPGGGLPAALMSGRNLAQIICKKNDLAFKNK